MFHLMYYLILKENGQQFKWTVRSIVSLVTYSGAAMVGGFCPTVAFIVVALVSAWWIIPQKK